RGLLRCRPARARALITLLAIPLAGGASGAPPPHARAPPTRRTPHTRAPAPPQHSELLTRVPLALLELFHDLIQVVARRILKGRELFVGFQLLQPQHLPDGQQVPVVNVSRDPHGRRRRDP